jgi:Flp pilus assembly protein TadD
MSGYRSALRYCEEACQLDPNHGESLNTLGVAYYRVGNYEKAVTRARDLVEVFELAREPEVSPRYNIAPTQNVAVVQ